LLCFLSVGEDVDGSVCVCGGDELMMEKIAKHETTMMIKYPDLVEKNPILFFVDYFCKNEKEKKKIT
jgi:hypothetical protein